MKHLALAGLLCFTLTACRQKPAASSAPTVSEASVGVPFYPGSSEWGTGSAKTEEEGRALSSSSRETSDDPEKVIAYYKKNLRDVKVRIEGVNDIVHTALAGQAKDGSEAEVVVMKMPNQKTQIFLSVARARTTPSPPPAAAPSAR